MRLRNTQSAGTKTQMYSSLRWGAKNENGNKVYPLHKYQKECFKSTARFTAGIAGTGGGKTALGALWAHKKAIEAIDKRGVCMGMVLAPTYKVLDRATVPSLLETFHDTPLQGEYKQQRGFYELPRNLGRIWCQGADNPGGLEGGQFDFAWGDEAGQFTLSVWDAIQGRTGAKESPILLTTTGYNFGWLYTEFFLRFRKGDPDYKVVQWNSIENPTYAKAEYERAKRTMTPDKFAMRYQGQFAMTEGMVYPGIDLCIDEETRVEQVLEKDGRLYGGIDFGWNDPFAALCGLLDLDDVLWIWFERYMPRCTIEQHAERLPKFYDRRPMWYCDHNPELIAKLRRGGHTCREAYKNIIPGVDAVNARILSGKLRILQRISHRNYPALIVEARSLTYPKNDDDLIVGDKPDPKAEQHACDALRYLITGIDLRRAA